MERRKVEGCASPEDTTLELWEWWLGQDAHLFRFKSSALTSYRASKGAVTSCSVVTGDAGLQQELKDLWALSSSGSPGCPPTVLREMSTSHRVPSIRSYLTLSSGALRHWYLLGDRKGKWSSCQPAVAASCEYKALCVPRPPSPLASRTFGSCFWFYVLPHGFW